MGNLPLFAQRTAEQVAQQKPVDAGVRDDGRASLRMRVGPGERGTRAGKALCIALAAGRAGEAGAADKVLRVARANLLKGQTVPFAAVELDEVVKHMKRPAAGDRLGGLAGAQQRAREDGLQRQRCEKLPEPQRLRPALCAEGQVVFLSEAHLRAARVVRQRVPDQVNLLGCHHVALLPGDGCIIPWTADAFNLQLAKERAK